MSDFYLTFTITGSAIFFSAGMLWNLIRTILYYKQVMTTSNQDSKKTANEFFDKFTATDDFLDKLLGKLGVEKPGWYAAFLMFVLMQYFPSFWSKDIGSEMILFHTMSLMVMLVLNVLLLPLFLLGYIFTAILVVKRIRFKRKYFEMKLSDSNTNDNIYEYIVW